MTVPLAGSASVARALLLVALAAAVATGAPSGVPRPAVAGPAVDVTAIVAKVLPSVVSITTRRIHQDAGKGRVLTRGLGSGVIVDRRGYILTNHHVVEEVQQIKVGLTDERVFPARLVGADPTTDLAVLKIEGTRLPVATLGDSGPLRVGELVIAVGNPLWIEGGPTVTVGVVSGLGRVLEQPGLPMLHHLVQTDAAINEGNSGGPLVNRAGQVVGINTAVIASAHGIGFAIPMRTVRPVLRELLAGRPIVRPTLDLKAVSVTPQLAFANDLAVERGVLVLSVDRAGPAGEAGILEGDIITSVAGQGVKDLHDFHEVLWRRRPGDEITVRLIRDGHPVAVQVRPRIDTAPPLRNERTVAPQ